VKGEIEKFLNVKTYQDYNFGVKKIKFSGTIRYLSLSNKVEINFSKRK